MATGATELPIPPNEGEPAIIINMEEVYRDKLNAPIFTGVEDVEQFIEEFTRVLDVTQ